VASAAGTTAAEKCDDGRRRSDRDDQARCGGPAGQECVEQRPALAVALFAVQACCRLAGRADEPKRSEAGERRRNRVKGRDVTGHRRLDVVARGIQQENIGTRNRSIKVFGDTS